MPLVTANPRGRQDGSTVTEFTDTTNTSAVSYTYPSQQSSLIIENSGERVIYVTVGSVTDQSVQVDTKYRYDGSFTTFSIRSDVNSQEFIATAIYKAVQDLTEVNDQLTNLTTSLADKVDVSTIPSEFLSEFVRIGNLQTFKDAIAKRYCKIAFFGDSITGGGDYLDINDRWVEQFIVILKRAFPNVVFEYQNFGIGGRTLEQATSSAYVSPTDFTATWATTDGKAWRTYVFDYNPDLLFIAFGMNPNATGSIKTSNFLYTLTTYFNAHAKPTSIVLMSNLVPKKDWASNWNDRVISSRQTSIFAKANNYSFLDVFNKYRALIDGKDESRRLFSMQRLGAETVADETYSGYFRTTYKTVNFKINMLVYLNDTNEYEIKFRSGGVVRVNKTLLTTTEGTVALTLATGWNRIIVDLSDRLIITIANVEVYNQLYYTSVDEGYVRFGWKLGTGDITQPDITDYKFLDTTKSMSEADLYGEYVVGDTSLKYLTGGNGVNHPSSKGYNYFYVPLVSDFIKKFNDVYKKETSIQKTYALTLSNAATYSYVSVGSSDSIPYLTGLLESPTSVVFTERKDLVFSIANAALLGANEYIIRRTGGVVQIIVPLQGTLPGWKFTTNVLL